MSQRQAVRFAPIFLPWLFEPHPIKVAFGGRGGAKSWAFAQALIIRAYSETLKILCAREFQTSIRDSVHSVLKNRIEAMGLSAYFSVTHTSIKSLTTGSEFIFKGLHMNPHEIKSIEGIDICWVEEAQSVSEDSWETLLPTIRKDGSEVWISFNPLDPEAPSYKRWVVDPPAYAKVVKINWSDNPWFPEALDRQRRAMAANENEQDAYLHVWEGHPRTLSESTIFRHRFVVEPFEEPEMHSRLYYGADFGFANDPSTLIRSYIQDNKLFITHEAYAVGVEIDDMPALYKGGRDKKLGIDYPGVPGATDWPIFADSARPETISYLRRQGFYIQPADKWQGSVEDGIAHLKGFDKIVIHPRCVNTATEFRLYSYKTDPKNSKVVLPIIVDAHNHCIAEGQMITTARGYVPIEGVAVDDLVATRDGWRRVYSSRKTSDDRDLWVVRAGGKELYATSNHEILTINRGFIRVDALSYDDVLLIEEDQNCSKGQVAERERLSSMVDTSGTDIQTRKTYLTAGIFAALTRSFQTVRSICIGQYMKSTTALSPMGRMFTTKMKTLATMIQETCSALPLMSIPASTLMMMSGWNANQSIWTAFDRSRWTGINLQRGAKSTRKLAQRCGKTSSHSKPFASSVGPHSRRTDHLGVSFAATTARLHLEETADWTTRPEDVPSAAGISYAVDTRGSRLVPASVVEVRAAGRTGAVFDLSVEGCPEFIASGILVHNCVDALRYSLNGYITKRGTLGIWERLAS